MIHKRKEKMKTEEPNEDMFSSQTFCKVCKVGLPANDWDKHLKSASHKENLKIKGIMERYLRENSMCLPPDFCV